MKLRWQKAPRTTEWGEGMVISTIEIDKDHTLDLYCERDQIPFIIDALKRELEKGTNENISCL